MTLGMDWCSDNAAHTIIDMDWSMQSVVDKTMVAPPTCYSTEKDLEKKTGLTGFTLCECLCSGRNSSECMRPQRIKQSRHLDLL